MFRRKSKVDSTPDFRDRPKEEEKEDMSVDIKTGFRLVYLYPAAVKEIGGNKWGYINSKGKWVLSPIYDQAGEFQENELAIISYMGLSGIINLNGYLIVKPRYDIINLFSEGRATVLSQRGFNVIDESGKELTAREYSLIGDYKEGRALIGIAGNGGKYLYGYLNKWGKEVISPSYEAAGDFESGKAVVKLHGGQYALIGATGKTLHTYPYEWVGEYGEGLLAFKSPVNGKYGYMNEMGKMVIEPQFDGTQAFIAGRAIVQLTGDSHVYYGLIDDTGRFIFKPAYNDLLDLGEGRVALGKALDTDKPFIGSTYAIGDHEGHILTGFIYNRISKYENGFASASDNQSTFFVDKRGIKAAELPIVNGSGTMQFDKSLIKGEIDFRLVYFNKKGERIWEQNRSIPLRNGQEILEEKYKPNKDFLIYYPQLNGIGTIQPTVNQTLKDLSGIKETPSHLLLESNYMGDFEVSFHQGNLLAIEIIGYEYPYGAEHGTPTRKYAHIDLLTGNFYQLKDLFKPGSQYVRVISAIIGKQFISDKTYSSIFPGSYKGIQRDQPFFVTNNALFIYFAPNEIAPYSAGFQTFTIRFEEIAEILDVKGAFWKSFHPFEKSE